MCFMCVVLPDRVRVLEDEGRSQGEAICGALRKAIQKNYCFPSQRASLLENTPRKTLFLISLNLMYLALQ